MAGSAPGLRLGLAPTVARYGPALGRRLVVPLGLPQVVVVVPDELAQSSGSDLDDAGGQGIDEGPVVGDQDQRSPVLPERFFQDLAGLQVQVVGGLVEHQEVGGSKQHLREGETGLLATREHCDLLLHVVAGEQKGAQMAAQTRRDRRVVATLSSSSRTVRLSVSASSWCCA